MLDRVATGKCRRLMVFMPPQHGKSELVSRRFPAFMLGRNPDLRLIAPAPHQRPGREHEPRRAADHDQRRLPGSLSARPRLNDQLDPLARPAIAGPPHHGPLRDPRPPRQPALGRAWATRSPATRPTARSSTTPSASARTPTARSCGSGSGIGTPTICTRGSRPRPGSCSRTPAGTATTWPAGCCGRWPTARPTSGRSSACRPSARKGPGDPCDTRQPGEPLWPPFKSAADLEIIRQQDARAYAALYQQNPTDASVAEWAAGIVRRLDVGASRTNGRKEFDLRVVCVDASKGRSDKQGDYSAIVFMGVGKDKLLYVDAILDRIPLDQIVRKTVVFCDEKKPDFVGIEAEQFQELLVHEFRRQCGERLRRALADVRDDEPRASPRSPASAG